MFDERTVVATLNMNEPGALNTDNKDLQMQKMAKGAKVL